MHLPSPSAVLANRLTGATIVAMIALAGLATPIVRAAAPAEPLVIGQTFRIDSKVLGETRRINVYLPPGYADQPQARFPVLYMLDGGIKEDFLHIAGLVEVETGNNSTAPMILVGIENTQRRRDLTGPTTDPRELAIAPVVGQSAAFRRFLRDELMPEVRTRYRTNGERAIVGESLAGLFVVETLFVQPGMFDTWIAVDPSLWWNHGALVGSSAAALASLPTAPRTLFLACSSDACPEGKDGSYPVPEFAAVLRAHAPKYLRWFLRRYPHETHATVFHPAAMDAFRTVFASPARPPH